VTDLARQLDELGARLEFPPTPELAPAVLARMAARRRGRRRVLVVALAAVVLVAAVLAVSPGARSAIRDWLGLGGVQIVRVDELPEVERRDIPPFLGERVPLEQSRRRVEFAIAWPRELGEPDEVWVRDYPPGGAVTLVYGSAAQPRLLLTEWRGYTTEPVFLKTVAPGTRIETVNVGVSPGVWLDGAPHAVVSAARDGSEYEDMLWLAGNVLVWERGGRAFRLEADVGRDDAIRIAEDTR
jgi:hypothetical protein